MIFVKICGITSAEAGRAAAAAGADAVGFVFYPPSRRYVTPRQAGAIAAAIPRGPARVGVFVDASLAEIAAAAAQAGLDFLQLHGDETPDFCREARTATGCRVIRAFRVRTAADVAGIAAVWSSPAASGAADYFLLDALVEGQVGGTGQRFDWRLVAAADLPAPVILAGGLTPENVATALTMARPAGVDVSTGVETEGRKDPAKIHRFVEAVRRWEHGGGTERGQEARG